MIHKSFRFMMVLWALGMLMAAAVAYDLVGRGLHRSVAEPQWPVFDADPEQGRRAIVHYGCNACHVIPGIRGVQGRVGPKLEDFVNQMYIAGVLPNTPEHLVEWIQHPQQVNPLTVMPDLNVSEEDARAIVAYLYSHP